MPPRGLLSRTTHSAMRVAVASRGRLPSAQHPPQAETWASGPLSLPTQGTEEKETFAPFATEESCPCR